MYSDDKSGDLNSPHSLGRYRKKGLMTTNDIRRFVGIPTFLRVPLLGDVEKPKELESLTIQCDMCGCRLNIPIPKKHRYTVACSYPECNHIMKFN